MAVSRDGVLAALAKMRRAGAELGSSGGSPFAQIADAADVLVLLGGNVDGKAEPVCTPRAIPSQQVTTSALSEVS
ncbi:hypothetical protein [Kitasatospora cineracea]|uniref:hypothetical protein n=1 Tax=Kitasatospora cineracea TaxID=88074 RepID=UPI0036854B44